MSKCFGETSKNKIFALLCIFILLLFASCGGGGGGGGGAVSYAPDSNTHHNGGDAGGWGTGSETGSGFGGSTIEEDNATLLLGQSAALSYQKVDIDLIVNGEHFSITNVTATTTTEVLPKIPIGASVSGTATIYLTNGTTRVAELEMTEIGIHNNLVFKVPYNYKCIDATTGAETTSGTYLSREGIDLAAYTIAPIEGWKCLEDGSIHAGSYVTGVRGDITLEPVYGTGSSYIASFVTPVQSQSAPAQSFTSADIVQLPVLSSPNLTFEGWYEDSAFTGQPVSLIPAGTDENKTYYAKWTATVTFNGNGANETYPAATIVYGECVSQPNPDPTRLGFTFRDWRILFNGVMASTAYDFSGVVTENTELIVNWNADEYTVHYVSNDVTPDTSIDDDKYTVLTGLNLKNPTKNGLIFKGWYENPNLTGSKVEQIPIGETGSRTYYAKWEARVTFECNGGTGISTSSVVQYNRPVSQPSNPAKQYYTFGGWYTDSSYTSAYNFTTLVTQNITLYAKWNPIIFTVTYSVPSGIGVTVPGDTYTTVTGLDPLPTPPTSAFSFIGWYTDDTLNEAYRITLIQPGEGGNRILHGKWTARVTFDYNGGSGSSPNYKDVKYNDPVTSPTTNPARANYTFGGWYTDSACTTAYNFDAAVTQNKTLYAKWNPISHGLTYHLVVPNATGATSTTFNQHEGRSVLPSPTCSGLLTFVNWYNNSSYTGSAVTSIDVGTLHDVELWAKWNARVTFNSNGGSGVNPAYRDVAYNTTVAQPTMNPSWTNHRCLGWFTDSTCTTEFDFAQRITQNITLYAGWVVSYSGSGEKNIVYETGKTDYVVELNNFQNEAPMNNGSFNIKNPNYGTVMNVELSIVGTNKSIGWNHGGLKLTSNSAAQGGTINIVFSTSSSGTLELGFGAANSGDIQVENVTANFSIAPGCTISEMKVGDTTYTNFNSFINAAKAETNPSRKASFKITRN